MNRTRGIGAFLSLAVLAGVAKKGLEMYREATGWRRWAIIAVIGLVAGILIAIILRAFIP